MSAAQGRVYEEILRISHAGVLCEADGPVVEMVTALLHEFRASRGALDDKGYSKLYAGLDRLGMTPASRGKVALAANKKQDDENNPLREFGS